MGALTSCFERPVSETAPACDILPETQDNQIDKLSQASVQEQNTKDSDETHGNPQLIGKSTSTLEDPRRTSLHKENEPALKDAQDNGAHPDQKVTNSESLTFHSKKVNDISEDDAFSMVIEVSEVISSVQRKSIQIEQPRENEIHAKYPSKPQKLSSGTSSIKLVSKELKGVKAKIAKFNKLEELASVDAEAKVKGGDKRVVIRRKSPFVLLRGAVFERNESSYTNMSKIPALKQKNRCGKPQKQTRVGITGKQTKGRVSPRDVTDFISV